jgi:REP element-mobilizing transposase RayT
VNDFKKRGAANKSFLSFLPSRKNENLDSQQVRFEKVPPESYNLSYTCLLIPRATIMLKDELAKQLPHWLNQVCAANDWRVDFINVSPDYLQWGLRVAPSVQAGQFMKEIRLRTSETALARFESLRQENAGDFWAPGYLVVLGARPHPKEMIEQYVGMSRRQQGLPSA